MIIGITGSFGSGKTEVAKIFSRLGASIIDADKLCHALMKPHRKAYRKIVKYFGRKILKKSNVIDRHKLAKIVFKDKRKLKLLNSLIHPEVIKKIKDIAKTKMRSRPIVIDAPLLVETNLHRWVDILIVVRTKKVLQIKRLMRAKKLNRNEILNRIRMQAPLKKKIVLADFIIDNNGPKAKTALQVDRIWRLIKGV